MSRYASVEDVKNRLPQLRITGTSRPTEVEVLQMIEQVEGNLDSALVRIGYVTPVTGELSVRVLKGMVVDAVIAETIEAQAIGIRDPNELGAHRARAKYEQRLKDLADPTNPFELPDAYKTDLQTKLGIVSSSLSSDPDYGESTITRDQVF